MKNNMINGKSLVASAPLALVALLTLWLATNTQDSIAIPQPAIKAKVVVAMPSKKDLAIADRVARRDISLGGLTEHQANLYRVIFAAQKKGDWDRADDLIDRLEDRSLLGHVLADRFERRGASAAEMKAWLKAYPTLPDAKAIYKKAKKAGAQNITKPRAPSEWQSGGELDRAANFAPNRAGEGQKLSRAERLKARSIQRVIKKGRPTQAVKMLTAAVDKGTIGEFVRHDLEAMIAASYFHHDMKEKALTFAKPAADYGRPLALWISGLLSWGDDDPYEAYKAFSRLAYTPKLSANNRAAAHFWAYRAADKIGEGYDAKQHLRKAAKDQRSFYGMLAARRLGSNPVADLGDYDAPRWNKQTRDIIKASKAGWRALALVQVGQTLRAEEELRRLNPRGNRSKRKAMLAFASHAKMPALALRVAYLSKNQGLDSSLYPVLPWTPDEGFHIDRALLFALARQESRFDPKASSHAGAQGLMQIMPKTAKGIVRNSSTINTKVTKAKLLDPKFNMALGQKYVRELSRYPQIGKNLVMILASYNAGPGKAMKWMKAHDKGDPLYFLETIPVKETRHYVARVLSHYWAYRARLGKDIPSMMQMASGQWPKAPLYEKAMHLAAR